MTPLRFLLALAVVVFPQMEVRAADPTYWQDVRPILRKHCTVCHSERKLTELDVSAGLALDKPELIRKGSKAGKVPVLVPGKPDESLMVALLTTKDKRRAMPLDADPLPAADVAVIRKWVSTGAAEGTRPKESEAAIVGPAVSANVRKLPVTFFTRTTALPKASPIAAPIGATLPVGPLPPVAAVAFSPDGKLLAVGSYGRATVWDLTTAKPAQVITHVLGAVNDLKFSPDGSKLAVAGGQPSARGDLRIFDTKDWKLLVSLGGHLDTVSGVSWSPDSSKIASASFDKTVRIWDMKSHAVLHSFTGHSDFVYGVAFSPKGDWIATASKDRSGRIIDVASGKSTGTLSGAEQEVLAVAVNPATGQVVTSGFETAVSWWNAKTAERLRKTGGPGVAVHEIAFDAKGTIMVVAGGDGTLRPYDCTTGAAARAAQAGSAVFALAVDGPGKRMVSGAADGLVKLWDIKEARLLATFWSGPGAGEQGQWIAFADGYFSASDGLASKAIWKGDGKPVANAKLLVPLNDSARVAKAIQGEKLPEPVFPK
ncbi:MAG TPA: c-type cytochrome domain-containing protein [Urbifossiella sp.]|jgi:WD40 repeat protein